MQQRDDPGEDMPPPEHLLAQLHQLGDRVLPITDKLVQLRRYQCGRLGLVQLEPSGESLLGDEPDLHERAVEAKVREIRTRAEEGALIRLCRSHE